MEEEEKGGVNSLAHVLQDRMNTVTESSDKSICDIGTINSDKSLSLRMFPITIPDGQYLVCRSLRWGEEGKDLNMDTEESDGHKHKEQLPKCMRELQAGDTVFCCWVDSDVVVVDIIGTTE